MIPSAGAMVLARRAWARLSALAILADLAQHPRAENEAEIGFVGSDRRVIAVPLAP